jgi:ATP-dependent Clp protease ATP-binding subunit ClpC
MGEHAAEVSLTDEATELLVDKGYDPTMGARPLRRAIQRFIEDPLADYVLGRELEPGVTILVDKKADTDDEVELTLIPGAPPEDLEKVTVPPEEPKDEGGDDSEEPAAE